MSNDSKILSWIIDHLPVTFDEIVYHCEIPRSRARKIVNAKIDKDDSLYIERDIMIRRNYRPDPEYRKKKLEEEKQLKELTQLKKEHLRLMGEELELDKEIAALLEELIEKRQFLIDNHPQAFACDCKQSSN